MNTRHHHVNSISRKAAIIVKWAWKEYLDYVGLTYDLKKH